MKGGIYLSDREWKVLEPFLPKVKSRKDGRGRPPKDPHSVLNSIIWILFSGAPGTCCLKSIRLIRPVTAIFKPG